MAEKKKTTSLFDDIFRLQSTAPDVEVDPEDPIDGFTASLVEGVDQVETFETSKLRKQTAIIPDDPKYKGEKTSRKDLFFNDNLEDDADGFFTDSSQGKQSESEDDEEDDDDSGKDDDTDNQLESDDEDKSFDELDDKDKHEEMKEMTDVLTDKSDDRAKGKAVVHQLGVWDDLIRSRIVLQKMVTFCNRLPQADTWGDFTSHDSFKKEAKNAHSSVRKLVSTLLELQRLLLQSENKNLKGKSSAGDSDEEITSESEDEPKDEESANNSQIDERHQNGYHEDDMDTKDEDGSLRDDGEEMETDVQKENKNRGRLKQKLDVEEVEETIMKRHKDFQVFRNDTLSKWDEKTRLTKGKVKAKNFAAFEVSVLKQIEQVLVNRERLVKRLHQQRSSYRILGKPTDEVADTTGDGYMIDDDEDDVEMKLKLRTKQEVEVNQEIIDDNDFYHVCLRDLIEMKQNEETDPVTANKQWLEIQQLRNKQKRKVDTRASKGRKIRYHVKEKLKNYMAPYDKSHWSDEQKDDLFKALFGGRQHQEDIYKSVDKPTINLGI